MNTGRKLAAALLVSGAVGAAAVAVGSPAWAATCSLGADVPTSSNVAWGGRYNCSSTVSWLQVRFAKDVSFQKDPYYYHQWDNFGNGDAGTQGGCKYGAGAYYTWTVSSTGNSVESGRVGRC